MKLLPLLLLVGCADPVIEMSLRLPTANQTPANFDLSCVTAVDVVIAGNDQGSDLGMPDQRTTCVDLASGPSSFAAMRSAISGKVDLRLPVSGLAAVTIRGRRGACGDGRDYESVFYGGNVYVEGDDAMTIPVVANISCNTRRTYNVSAVDLIALVRTKTCTVPAQAEPYIFAGNIRPLMMGPDFPYMTFDFGESYAVPAAGKATIDSFTAPGTTRSCIAVGFDSRTAYAGSCINASAPTLCAATNELELPVIDDQTAFTSVDTNLVRQYGQPVYGAVFKASPASVATKASITGATVELEDPTQGTVVYVEPNASKLVPTGGSATGASGMFMIYLKGEPTNVIVKSGGSQQRYLVASSAMEPSTLLAVLP